MNLIELSLQTNRSVESLKTEINEQFGIKILSAHLELKSVITDYFEALMPVIQTRQFLKECEAKRVLILMDTCSLLTSYFKDFYKLYQQQGHGLQPLYVPYVVFEELKWLTQNHQKSTDLRLRASEALKFLIRENEKKAITIVGDDKDKRMNHKGNEIIHADRVLLEKLMYLRSDSRSILLITQDYDLTRDALLQNELSSIKTPAVILVKKLTKGGVLVDNTTETVNPKLPQHTTGV